MFQVDSISAALLSSFLEQQLVIELMFQAVMLQHQEGWFLFTSQRTLHENARLFARKFASNFQVERIITQKFAAYCCTLRTIERKFTRIETIDVAKMRRNILNCRRDFFSSEISSESHEKREFRRSLFALVFHNTVVDWICEPNFRCSLRVFTQQQITYCSGISLSLYRSELLTTRAKFPLKDRSLRSKRANFPSKFRNLLASPTNYRSKFRDE